MPGIRDEILNLGPVEKRRRKALRLAENATARLPITWAMGVGQNRTTITVTAASYDGEALRLEVTASKGAWTYSDDLRVINPPIMVPTGRMVPNPEGGEMNEYREDAVAAIRSVVESAVSFWQRRAA